MDWGKCIICQECKSETLKCPLNAVSGEKTEAYVTFLDNVSSFRNLGSLPVRLLFDEDLSVQNLVQNKAVWHKSCQVKFSKEKLERARNKRKKSTEEEPGSSKEKRTQRQSLDKEACLFCQKAHGHLHEFTTFGADTNLRMMARELNDTELMARISIGDVVAIEAKYHLQCLTFYRNRHRSFLRQKESSEAVHEENQMKAKALVEVVNYIEHCVEEGIYQIKFSVLFDLFRNRLKALGVDKEVNRGRFREKVMEYFPYAEELSDGKNMILVFQQRIQEMLKETRTQDFEEETMILAKAAKIIRKEITNCTKFTFAGSFPSNCQEKSIPVHLKTLVSMLLNGTDVRDQISEDSQATLTIAQLIVFNLMTHKSPSKVRHSLDREPPLPLYLGMKIHTEIRSKSLIKQLYNLGLSVSYDRILQVESQLATRVCQNFKNKGVVVPSQFSHGPFVAAALDNLDYNPSSTTAVGSFHGTGISLFQFPKVSNLGTKQDNIMSYPLDSKNLELPTSYSVVPAVAMDKAKVEVPKMCDMSEPIFGHFDGARIQERKWMNEAIKNLEKDVLEKGNAVSWSAYHAAMQEQDEDHMKTLSYLLPLFYEKAATPAMIKHGMDVVRLATEYLNPEQIPVIAFDAPLYSLAKFIQWRWSDTHGEDKIIVMFGGLHIEMAMWNTYGDYLEDSGWTNALTQAGVASPGTADSYLKASHLTRTRYAHQVTALTLAKLQYEAFMETSGPHDDKAMEDWRKKMVQVSPTFQYWDTVLEMEIIGLIFIRSHREGNFQLYVESVKKLVPFFFAFDHQNYARWLPVHIRDMENVPESIMKEFSQNGHWVVHKTKKRFSAMPLDQAHEQNNEKVKGLGGAIGLTENPIAFRKWMVSGPEQARLMSEYEEECFAKFEEEYFHHEEGLSAQKRFKDHVSNLHDVFCDMGNPFCDSGNELLVLDTRNVMDDSVITTVRTITTLGTEQYNQYYKDVVTDCKKSIHTPIKKNKLALFRCPRPKLQKQKVAGMDLLKNDVSLFSRLYIVMQHRDSDMDAFFQHENHPFPPSLSNGGKLRFGKKSDIQNIIKSEDKANAPDNFDAKFLDGAAIVHMLPTASVATFKEYAECIFVPYILKQLETCQRIDIVWDTYITNSLKESTREKRGTGIRRKVEERNKIPLNWQDFLKDSNNKQELFALLSHKVAKMTVPDEKEVVITSGQDAIIVGTSHVIPRCDHEEADTRLLVHIQDAMKEGHKNCLIRTVDSDVLVILIGKFHHLMSIRPDLNIWVGFGTGRNFTYHHINTICASLGEERCISLPVFHCFTGCDTTSSFYGRGKTTAWTAWYHYPDVTKAFMFVAQNPFTDLDKESYHFKLLERYTVVLYDKSSDVEWVDEARKILYCQKEKTMENIPPTQDALLQHTRRVIYQAGIWSTCDKWEQNLPSAEGWGWTFNRESQAWTPNWITRPIASKACSELIKCGCKSKSGCGTRCACKKAKWKCTDLCSCNCIV